MAETDQAILIELQKLNRTVSQGGSMGSGSELRGGASEPTTKDLMKEEADKNEKAMRRIRSDLSKSTNKYVAATASSIKSAMHLQKLEEKYSKQNLEDFLKVKKNRDQQLITAKVALDQARALGRTGKDLKRSEEDLIEETDELGSAFGRLKPVTEGQTKATDLAKKGLLAFAAIVGAVGKQYMDVQGASMRTGVEATAAGIVQSRMMGMTQEELIETQGQYRKVMESSQLTQDEFAAQMLETSHGLFAFTNDLKMGAKFGAESALMFRQLSGTGMKQAEFQKAQEAQFKHLNRTLSITADEFMAMNKQLMESHATRVQLFKMDKTRRAQYALELTNTMAYLEAQGLQTDQAHKVVESMQGLLGLDPKSRLKKAAQTQAMAGAIGMSAEGAELAAIMRSGADDRGSLTRMAELEDAINAAVQQRQGSNDLGVEMGMSAILAGTQTGDRFGAEGNLADVQLQKGLKAQQDTATNMAQISGWEVWLNKWYQISTGFLSEGWVQTIIGAIGGFFVAWLGPGAILTKIAGSFLSVGSGILSGITGMASAISGMATSLVGGLATLGKTAASTAVNVVKGIGPRLSTLAQGARVAAGPVAAAAAAAYGVQQAYQAITTGRSDVNDMLNSTETGRSIGDAIGSSIAHTLAFFGNDAAQEAVDINRQLAEQEAAAQATREKQNELTAETNALQRRQIQTTEAQTEAVVGSTDTAAREANRNQRSYNMRSRGRAPAS